MVRFLADENVESHVVETLIRRVPSVDIVSVHDVGLAAKDDRSILEWAASNERIVVTRDVSSMRAYADARVEAGLPMPGLVLIPSTESIGGILENLEDMALLSMAGEWEGQVLFVGSPPLAAPQF